MVRGSCLCGGVRFEADAIEIITNCHCSMCRKAHGAPYGSYANAYKTGFRYLSGEDLIQGYRSSPDNVRRFCRVCGSNLPHGSEASETWVIPTGLLDDDPGVRPCIHIFVGSKAPWHEIDDDLPAFEAHIPGFGPDEEGG